MNIIGLVASFGFIGLIIGIALLLSRNKNVKPEFVRKFIHVGVSNWWFLLLWGFDNLWLALIGPVFFIVGNSVAVFTGAADVLGISDRRRNYGLIYYPVSLCILVLVGFLGIIPLWACGMGTLAMGYGDGFAAVLGKRWGRWKINGKAGSKTLVGTVVMFIISLGVVIGFSIGYQFESLWTLSWWIGVVATALVAAALEAFTPLGLDNLTVPLGTALVASLVLGA